MTRGYLASSFQDAWDRYLPPLSGQGVTTVTGDITPLQHEAHVAPVTPVTALEDSFEQVRDCARCKYPVSADDPDGMLCSDCYMDARESAASPDF